MPVSKKEKWKKQKKKAMMTLVSPPLTPAMTLFFEFLAHYLQLSLPLSIFFSTDFYMFWETLVWIVVL